MSTAEALKQKEEEIRKKCEELDEKQKKWNI